MSIKVLKRSECRRWRKLNSIVYVTIDKKSGTTHRVFKKKMNKKELKKEIVLILNEIRSTHNVGAIFRTADACGISKIYFIGTTPTPIDRFGRDRKDVAKTALGAEKTIPWEYFENIDQLLTKLKKDNFTIVAIEQSKNSVDYKNVRLENNSAIILGNEVEGVSEKVLNECDIIAEIPMLGKKESLNVSVATGVVLFRILGI